MSSSTPAPELDVIFVHGLGSDAGGWINKDTGLNWPAKLEEMDSRLRCFAVEYYSPLIGNRGVTPSYQALAIKLFEDLVLKKVGKRPIIFVAHSLGGIIVKQVLRHAEAKKSPIYSQTRSVIFLATPHSGATIATLGGHLGSVIQILGKAAATFLPSPIGAFAEPIAQITAWQLRISDLTSQLRSQEPSLLDLNLWYRCIKHIDTRAYYETESFYNVLIVDPLSADPGVYGCDPVRAEGKDHITISKPADVDDDLFKKIADIVENVRYREKQGKGYPVLQNWIRASLQDSDFHAYADVGRFKDVPREERSGVEHRLREHFRHRLLGNESFDVEAAADSEFDIDAFAWSLWLEVSLSKQLLQLSDNIDRARSAVRSKDSPENIIQLTRAARTLDRTLLQFDLALLKARLASAHKLIESKCKHDPSLDIEGVTRQLFKRLEAHIKGFIKVKSDLADSPDFADSLGREAG